MVLLPKEIDNLANLTELSLAENLLTDIPQELYKLTKLQKLFFRDNKLTAIPKEIGNLTNLKEINLSNNCLASLSDGIINLRLDSFFIGGNPNLILTKKQEELVKSIKNCDWIPA